VRQLVITSGLSAADWLKTTATGPDGCAEPVSKSLRPLDVTLIV